MIIQDELLPTTLYFYRKCIKSKTREFKVLYLGSQSLCFGTLFWKFLVKQDGAIPLLCRWSQLLLIFSTLRGLSTGAPVFPSPEKLNTNSLWKASPIINDTGDTHRATSLSVLRSVKCTLSCIPLSSSSSSSSFFLLLSQQKLFSGCGPGQVVSGDYKSWTKQVEK